MSDGTQRKIMVILRLLSSRGGEPNDMWRQIMVIPHLFSIRRRSCPMARRDKLRSLCAFCHPEAASPMTCGEKLWSFRTPFAIQIQSCPMARGDKLWSFRTFFHPDTIMSDGTQRQIMVILCLSSSRGGDSDGMQIPVMVTLRLSSIERNEFGSIMMMLIVRC